MLIQNNIRPVFSFFNISCFISAERVQLTVQSHQLPQRVCGKIIDCLMPGPLTESRPYSLKHTHAEIDRHTLISTHIPKTPCWIIRGRRRVMRPGDRRDYWAKNIPLIIWTLFFFIWGMQDWSIDVLEYSFPTFLLAPHMYTLWYSNRVLIKMTGVTRDCYFDTASYWLMWKGGHKPSCQTLSLTLIFVLLKAEMCLHSHVLEAGWRKQLTGRFNLDLRWSDMCVARLQDGLCCLPLRGWARPHWSACLSLR